MYATNNYYREERNIYSKAYNFCLDKEEVPLILKKLCRHYKVSIPFVRFYGHRDSGSAGWRKLRLSHSPSMGLLIHEFGHYIKDKESMCEILKNVSHKGTSHHGLRFQACINQIHYWARSLNYWEDEILRKRTIDIQNVAAIHVREDRLKKDPQEILKEKIKRNQLEIKKKEDALGRYDKRLKYFQKLYGNKKKKVKMSIVALSRALEQYQKNLMRIG